jgi:heavy metal translocating P-type ATPase
MSTTDNPECAYCGLPTSGTAPVGEKVYCCFGCRFASAVTQAHGEEGSASWALVCLSASVFLTMNVMVFTMALWTWDDLNEPGAMAVLRNLFRYLCLVFALPVLFLLGAPLLANAVQSLRRGQFTTDLLLVLGVAAAYATSVVAVVREEGPVYFEVGCMVLVLVTLGRCLEARGKLRTTAALESLHHLLPDAGRVIRDECERTTPLDAIAPGDFLRVLPGERVPCDGVVRQQSATLDEQVLTGESQPMIREPGERVLAGSLNLDGDLYVEVTVATAASALSRMIELVQQARRTKTHFERLADRVTSVFLPLVVCVALVAAVWHGSRQGVAEGILTGLAVILIACPCALGLATPMAVWAALGQAATRQVLFRDGEAVERLANVRAVRLDKTGTLTTGTPVVYDVLVAEPTNRASVLHVAAQLAVSSTHPYAQAILRFSALTTPEPLPAVRTFPGLGLAAQVPGAVCPTSADGAKVYLGSKRLMEQAGLGWPSSIAAAAMGRQPVTYLGMSGTVEAMFLFREEYRPETSTALKELRDRGLNVAVLTGDRVESGLTVSAELGVPVWAGLLPEEKVHAIASARRQFGPVALVGDGINDAAALAASDVGIALGCGTDVAREAASVCLLGNDLRAVSWTVDLARQMVRVLRLNLFWAFAYNVIGLGFASTGYLHPVLAALAMVVSSLLVVLNSLRLTGEFSPAATPPGAAVPLDRLKEEAA